MSEPLTSPRTQIQRSRSASSSGAWGREGASSEQLPFVEPRDDLLDGLAGVLVLDDLAGFLLRRRVDGEDGRALALAPHAAGLDLRVARGLRVQRLLLRAHDRLERRVARFVDGGTDRYHGRPPAPGRGVAVRGARPALSGPWVAATTSSTSALPPSLICMAASIAWVSKGLRFFSPERSRRLLPASMRFSTAASGTSFTRTQIFK